MNYSRVAQGIRRREIRLLNNDGVKSASPLRRAGAYPRRRLCRSALQSNDRPRDRLRHQNGPLRAAARQQGQHYRRCTSAQQGGRLFTDHDQALLEGIAAQSIPALRSSQTVERMQKARAQQLAFLDIVADITSQIDLDQLLQRVMTEATRMLGAERSTLFLHDEKNKELFSRVAIGPKIGEIPSPTMPKSRAPCSPLARRLTFPTPMPTCASTRALTNRPGSSRAHPVHAGHQQTRQDHRRDPSFEQERRPVFAPRMNRGSRPSPPRSRSRLRTPSSLMTSRRSRITTRACSKACRTGSSPWTSAKSSSPATAPVAASLELRASAILGKRRRVLRRQERLDHRAHQEGPSRKGRKCRHGCGNRIRRPARLGQPHSAALDER